MMLQSACCMRRTYSTDTRLVVAHNEPAYDGIDSRALPKQLSDTWRVAAMRKALGHWRVFNKESSSTSAPTSGSLPAVVKRAQVASAALATLPWS